MSMEEKISYSVIYNMLELKKHIGTKEQTMHQTIPRRCPDVNEM